MNISLSNIAVLNRGRKKYEKLQELAQSLVENGQLQNIIVRKPNADEIDKCDGKEWVLVAGGRRLAAATLADLSELRATVLDDMPPWKQRAIELEENVQREDMHWTEVVEMKLQIQELYEAHTPNWRQEDTARLLGVTPGHVSRDLQLAKEMRVDPSLKNNKSRVAALRQTKIRKAAREQTARIATTNLAGLEERVRCEDGRQLLARLETASVDLVFTDLPWGIDYYEGTDAKADSEYDDSADTTRQLIDDMVPEMLRVTRPTGWIVIIMNWQFHQYLREKFDSYCGTHIEPLVDGKRCAKQDGCKPIQCEPISWLWYRPNSVNLSRAPERHASNDYELILVCNRGEAVLHTAVRERLGNVLMYSNEYTDRIHSMQKPEDLCDEIILRCTLNKQVVVDPCCGSGAIPRSAAKLNRGFYASELNPAMFKLAFPYISETYKGEPTMQYENEGPELPDDAEEYDTLNSEDDELDEIDDEDEDLEEELAEDDEDEEDDELDFSALNEDEDE